MGRKEKKEKKIEVKNLAHVLKLVVVKGRI